MPRRADVLGHSGDVSVSWSIVLHAGLSVPAEPAPVQRRLADVVREHPQLGPSPVVESVADAAVRDAFAADPYVAGGPLVRVAVDDRSLVIAAHHSVLDGLGLLVLLGRLLDAPVTSSAAGIGQTSGRPFLLAAAGRLANAAFRPPGRVAPSVSGGDAGEILAEVAVPRIRFGTADLVAAAAGATLDWNAARGEPAGRIMAAVGASRRGGASARLADDSAYLRIPATPSPAQVAAAIAGGTPEPAVPESAGMVARAAPRALTDRLGSTFLASNLGRVEAPVRTLSFYPVTGGRSGVAFGAVSVADTTTLTLRARRRDFDTAGATDLLKQVLRRVEGAT